MADLFGALAAPVAPVAAPAPVAEAPLPARGPAAELAAAGLVAEPSAESLAGDLSAAYELRGLPKRARVVPAPRGGGLALLVEWPGAPCPVFLPPAVVPRVVERVLAGAVS
jgi:hypothetical protein